MESVALGDTYGSVAKICMAVNTILKVRPQNQQNNATPPKRSKFLLSTPYADSMATCSQG